MDRPGAVFSPDRVYRYQLWREFDLTNPAYVQFIGLNPSTADETRDDPTIRRCIDFAKRWGYGALCMTNLFAFRATEPDNMKAAAEPVGVDNDKHLLSIASGAGLIVAGWGVHGAHLARDAEVLRMFTAHMLPVHCMGRTREGRPKHPLYILATTKPERFDSYQSVG